MVPNECIERLQCACRTRASTCACPLRAPESICPIHTLPSSCTICMRQRVCVRHALPCTRLTQASLCTCTMYVDVCTYLMQRHECSCLLRTLFGTRLLLAPGDTRCVRLLTDACVIRALSLTVKLARDADTARHVSYVYACKYMHEACDYWRPPQARASRARG